jgi:hypothetical protein
MSVGPLFAENAVQNYAVTGDRVVASTAALLALAGAIAGGLALARRGGGRGTLVALAAGLAGTLVGAFVVVTAEGGPGSGSGIVGGYVALVLGVVALGTGWMARSRQRSV